MNAFSCPLSQGHFLETGAQPDVPHPFSFHKSLMSLDPLDQCPLVRSGLGFEVSLTSSATGFPGPHQVPEASFT
jgi:hypothetical protein